MCLCDRVNMFEVSAKNDGGVVPSIITPPRVRWSFYHFINPVARINVSNVYFCKKYIKTLYLYTL